MALGQELGLVLPTFAHAGVVKALQPMWEERGRGRAHSWLEGRGKKRESCLKQNPLNTKSPPVDLAKGKSRAGSCWDRSSHTLAPPGLAQGSL